MPTQNQQQNEILSQIEVVKQFNDFSKIPTSSSADSLLTDLKSKLPNSGKKLGDYQKDINKAVKDSVNDLFNQMITIANTFISTSSQINNAKSVSAVTDSPANSKTVTVKTKLFSTSKLQEYAHIALNKTLDAAPSIVVNDIKEALFAGDGMCGTNSSIMIDDVRLAPSEIDFFGMLQIDPTTSTGQIMYEPKTPSTGRIKFDRELYKSFTTGQYDFYGLSGARLFSLNWDNGNQNWNITGLTQGLSNWTSDNIVTGQTVYFNDFFNDYYASIEYPKLDDVLKKALLMTLQSDDSATPIFNAAFNDLNRLLSKLFAVCGSNAGDGNGGDAQNLVNQTPSRLFSENDQDIISYFNFDDVEGIDLDAEDAKLRNVLKFRDCNNFEIPVNKQINQDFSYLVNRKPTVDAINQTLEKTAANAQAQSNSSIPKENFHINLLNNYILNLPRALVSSVLGPKMFFPLVLVYKIYVVGVDKFIETKDLMKKLSKLFAKIINDLFWKFLNEFWRLVKRDLLRLLSQIVASIITNKNKRFLLIITSLLAILKRLLSVGLNCEDYFGIILTTIKSALNGTGKPDGNLPFPDVPGFILANAYLLPGYSQDRSLMNIIGKMQKAGINTNPIYGVPNDIIPFVKSIIDGHIEEQDTNGFVKVSNKLIVIPQAGPVPPLVIPPGALILSGKVF